MPLGTEVGLGTGDIVLDGDSAFPTVMAVRRLIYSALVGTAATPTFRPTSIVGKRSPIAETAELLFVNPNGKTLQVGKKLDFGLYSS